MDCQIDPKTLRCLLCDSQFSSARTLCACPSFSVQGLGDMVAAGLSAIGITKDLVSKAVGRDCGCAARQQAMNEWGKKNLGIG